MQQILISDMLYQRRAGRVRPPKTARRRTKAKPEAALADNALVSIVDDDPAFRDSLRRLLRSLGFVVEAFSSAADFLSSAELTTTACLVADVQMPAMSGIELHKHLVHTGHVIPTILVTAYPNESTRARMRGLGVVCYLPKPLIEADLIECLRSALLRSVAARPAQ